MKSDAEILSIIEHEEQNALGYLQGELSQERADALDYYEREPRGDEIEGQSAVISSDVADTIDWALPDLIKIFTASDKAVEFEPEGPEDEQAAKQATQVVNYVFYRQNQGVVLLHNWFKDALIQKNGYVKYWWSKQTNSRKQKYRGLTDEQLALLLNEEKVETLAHTQYPAQNSDGSVVQLHDIDVKVTVEQGKCCIEAVPPEEILVNRDHRSLDLQSARFAAHRCRKSVSELREMGYPEDKIREAGDGDTDLDQSIETIARDNLDDERQSYEDSGDKTTKTVWVTEAYILIDEDEDGIAERRRIVKAGRVIFEDDECERVCISSITPKMRPHKHIGNSMAEDAMDIQDVNTGLLRGTLNNLYLTNAPRMLVLSDSNGNPKANLDDLLTVRVGGVVRQHMPGAVEPIVVPYVGNYSMGMMEYMDQKRMNRTGVNYLSSGVDANSINKTARGAVIADNRQAMRIELIARLFAEGVKDLFQGLLYLLCTYSDRPLVMRLRNEFVSYDPREWNHLMDMTINVGLGTGNKDQQLMHLQTIGTIQATMIQGGFMNRLVTEKNLYNTASKTVENAGFQSPEDFFTDPEKAGPPPPPKPSPEEQKMQADIQNSQIQMQMDAQKNQQSAYFEQQKLLIEAEKARQQVILEAWKAQQQIELQREKQRGELMLNAQMGAVHAAQEAQKQQMDGAREDFRASTEASRENQKSAMEAGTQSIEKILSRMDESFNNLGQILARPRKITRGADGRATGVE